MTTGIMYSIIFFQFPMRIISGRSNFLKAIFHSASLNIQKITQQCVRLFYSDPYPPCFFMGGCDLGWDFWFSLINQSQAVTSLTCRSLLQVYMTLIIFAFIVMGMGGTWLCWIVHQPHPLMTFSKVICDVSKFGRIISS